MCLEIYLRKNRYSLNMETLIMATANEPTQCGITYTENDLKILANNKQFFYDENKKQLIYIPTNENTPKEMLGFVEQPK